MGPKFSKDCSWRDRGGVIGVRFLEIYCSGQHTDMSKVVIFGMNEVAMPRNGPRLWENGATGSRKVLDGSGASGRP